MELLIGLVALGFLVGLPLLAVIALARAASASREVRELWERLTALEARLDALGRRAAARGAEPASAAATPVATTQPLAPTAVPVAPPPPAPAVPAVSTATAPRPPATAPPEAVRPTPPPAVPPRPRTEPPPPPSFDWESLLGLRGAAWLGAVTLVIASLLFAKWAIDHGLVTPELRIAGLVAAGVAALVWAELSLRRGYTTTANAVSGAGIAILYIAFYSGHALYRLLPLAPTFGLMALVTVVAGLLAVRYDAQFTAVLGLLGGFATPLALSTGVDRPIGLFSYVLLLNVGLAAIAMRKRWHGLVLLALAATFVIEVAWFGRFMAPEKLLVGLIAFLVFGLLYLILPLLSREKDQPTLLRAGALGGTAPFLFAVPLAADRAYAGQWPLLFLYVGLLDAALVAIAVLRGRVALSVGGALATAVTLPLWAGQGLSRDELWGPTLAAAVLTLLLNAGPRLGRRLAPERSDHASLFEATGLLAGAGLGLFALVLVARGLGEPPWVFLFLLAVLTALLTERTGKARLRGVAVAGPLALAVLVQIWFFSHRGGELLLRNLSPGLLLALALSVIAARRARAPKGAVEDEAGVLAAVGVVVAGLFACLASPELGREPSPLLSALALAAVLAIASALRRDWTIVLPIALATAAVYAFSWQVGYLQPADLPVALGFYCAFYLSFLLLPFAVPEPVRQTWRARPLPWVTSALSGPAFFLPLYGAATRGWGSAFIGMLPLALAAVSVVMLSAVARRFVASATDPVASARRLRFLALFGAVALGFVTLAIPLQLERQWITVGWALEATAVLWLFGRVPHPGLKLLSAGLYLAVGVRLLLNPEVLRYSERGLPILNWLLYTYGVPALCCLFGARLLAKAEAARGALPAQDALAGDRERLAPAISLLGLLLVFWLVNLEILDYFSVGRYVEVDLGRRLARDLTLSLAWGLYALTLLGVGLLSRSRGLRLLSLGFLLLTASKVFLYDLEKLTGLYRILSFVGLGVALILVSLVYQRFVFEKERAR